MPYSEDRNRPLVPIIMLVVVAAPTAAVFARATYLYTTPSSVWNTNRRMRHVDRS
jgi:hypothetical protein